MAQSNYSFLSKFKKHVNSSMILIFFTVLALICANIPGIKEWYASLWETPVHLSFGGIENGVVNGFNFFSHNSHAMSLGEVINDFLMAIFFLSVGLEIKREIRVGELSTREKALLPIIGACGGMIVPVLLFSLCCPCDPEMQRGLAIPMATDIAFSLGVLAIFKTRVPIGLKIFLAALAVADDLGGIIVIALFYSSDINTMFLLLSAITVIAMIAANFSKVRSKAFYVTMGLLLWYLMLNSGIHATIAGVITAFCIPATLKKPSVHYLSRIVENVDKFRHIHETSTEEDKHKLVVLTNEEVHVWKSIESAADKMISPLQDLEDNLHFPINYIVIPLFAFANAGIDFAGMSIGGLFSGVGLAIMVGLVLGKFIGVFSFSWLAVKMKFVSLPAGTDWKAFASVCVICGIGFTVSMFIAGLSYTEGSGVLAQAKLGVLCGSVIAAVLGCIFLNRFLPKADK